MKVQTRLFGTIEVNANSIITLLEPLAGFPKHLVYAILRSADTFPLVWLQSIDTCEICFPMLDPRIVKPDYSISLSGVARRELGLLNGTQPELFVLVVIPEDIKQMTANLRAPLVINPDLRLGRQLILDEPYPIRYPIVRTESSAQTSETACVR